MQVRGLGRERVDELVHSYDVVFRRAVKKTLAAVLEASTTTTALTAAAEGVEVTATTFSAMDAVASIQAVWGAQVSEDLGPELAQLFFLAGSAIHAQVAKGVATDVTSSKMTLHNAAVFLNVAVPRVNGFSTELWEVAKTQVTLGLQDGESMKEIAQRIEDVAVIKAAKATVIAHTTAMAAISGGEYEQMKTLTAALGVTCTKQWEATEDSHTRPTHAAADGQIVDLHAPFQVGDAQLAFPSDPTGPANEVISCRCSTLYDIDVDDELQASGHSSKITPYQNKDMTGDIPFIDQSVHVYWPMEDYQTSPGAPSSQSAVATNGQTWEALTAAFKASEHPRGKDGRFIKKGVGLPNVVFDALGLLKKHGGFEELSGFEQDEFVGNVPDITAKQWANLKSEDKKRISDAMDEALEKGVPGSATAVSHIEDLRGGDEDDVDVFDPETTLPEVKVATVPTKKDVEQAIYDAHDTGQIDEDMQENLLKILDKKGIDDATKALLNVTALSTPTPTPTKPTKKSPFEILADTGDNGDGYAAPGLWGKYGAAGVLIAAPGDDGKPRFLMVQRGPMVSSNKGKWQLAGGALNSKETPEQGAAREIFEEIGAPQEYLATMEKLGSHDIEVPIPGKKPWKYSNIVATAPTMFKPKIDGTETGDAKWLTEEEIQQLATTGQLHPALAKNLPQIFNVYNGGKKHTEAPGGKSAVGDVAEPPAVSSAPAPAPAPAPATTTVTKATPIKMTHGLIHAKHTPGEVIAQTKDKNGKRVRVTWNGKEYFVDTQGQAGVQPVKKSALYAYLAKEYPNAAWVKPGKQDVEVDTPSVTTPSASAVSAPSVTSIGPLSFPPGTQTSDASVAWHNADFLGDPFFHESGKYKIESKYGSVRLFRKKPNGEWDTGEQADEGTIPIGVWGDQEPVAPAVNPVPAALATPGPSAPKVSTGAGLDMTGWKKLSGQKGSNKGGIFQAPDGTKYYVKGQKSQTHAKNEVLAATLYAALGVDFPEVRHVNDGTAPWKNATASKIVEGVSATNKLSNPSVDPKFIEQIQSGFAVDAWLSNWDVVGAAYDNIIDANGKPMRIDAGGALLYRAMGTPKDNVDFNDKVLELKSLKTSWQNTQAAKTFGSMTPEQERASAKLLLGITDAQIDQMVKDAGMDQSLADKLKKRRKYILDEYGLDDQNASTPPPVISTSTPTPTPTASPSLTKDDYLKQWNKGLLTTAEYKLLTGEDPVISTSTPKTYAYVNELWDAVKADVFQGKYKSGDVVATGKSAKHPNAKYRVIIGDDGFEQFQYKTPNFDWKTNDQPQSFNNVKVEWTVNPPSPTAAAPSTPSAAVSTVPHLSEDVISNWPGVVGKSYAVDEVVALSIDGKYKLRYDEDDDGNVGFGLYDASNNFVAGYTPKSVANGEIQDETGGVDWVVPPGVSTASKAITPTSSTIDWAAIIDGAVNEEVLATSDDGVWTATYMAGTDDVEIAKYGAYYSALTPEQVKAGGIEKTITGVTWKVAGSTPSAATSMPVTPATPTHPTTGTGHISLAQKMTFYNNFKAEKVSPAWSGAKIYNSIQVAKMKMAGDAQVAALTDEQMLDVVDEVLKIQQPSKYSSGDSPFKAKVVDWLKTPNGKKAAIAAKSGGWASATVTAPAGAKKTAKVVKKAAGSGFVKKSIADIIGTATVNQVDGYTQQLRTKIYNAVKAQPTGNSVKSPPAELFASIHKVAKDNGLSESEVISIMQLETTKKYGSVKHTYGATIGAWLNTPAGNKAAQEIQAGTYVPPVKAAKKAAKKASGTTYGSSYSGHFDFPANTPHSQKVALIGDQIEPFNGSKTASDFAKLSPSQAETLWNSMQAQQGAVTASQKSSLKYYTSNAGYSAMNGYLRGKKGATQATQDHINKAQEGMRRLPQDVVFHRGSGYFTGWGSYAEIKAREGTVWQEPAFFSASVGGKSAFGGSIAYIIEAPAGTPAAYVGMKGASNYVSEKEFFLAAGLKYQVISVENKGSSTTSGSSVTVRLRVVPDSAVAANIVASGS